MLPSTAFAPTTTISHSTSTTSLSSSSSSTSSENELTCSRRDSFFTAAKTTGLVSLATTMGMGLLPDTANAYANESVDKANIIKGYKRLTYLIDNWEKETTVCGRFDNPYIGNNGCERTPEKVMEYLGFKSMNDPLFRADKTMQRLQALVGEDVEIDYMEAMETFNEKSEEASNIAFVSSWGEANPGGGKDRVELFIERSKKLVMTSRDSLGTCIDLLGLKVE